MSRDDKRICVYPYPTVTVYLIDFPRARLSCGDAGPHCAPRASPERVISRKNPRIVLAEGSETRKGDLSGIVSRTNGAKLVDCRCLFSA